MYKFLRLIVLFVLFVFLYWGFQFSLVEGRPFGYVIALFAMLSLFFTFVINPRELWAFFNRKRNEGN